MEIKGRVLLAEDDMHLGDVMKDTLEDEGYAVSHCIDGQQAIDLFDKDKFDICLLDVMMPVKDGFTVAKKIRQQTDIVPIIFISTKALLEDKIEGYQKGADDYIVKPFQMQELLMKMEVFLRRTKKMFADTLQEFSVGKIHFQFTNLKMITPEGTITITQKEAELLKFLCLHPNRILKRDEILTAVWGKDDYFLGRSMDVFMTKIRKLLKADPAIVLETIHGMGFRFSVPENNR
ncbi:MAG: response regulator transcription factor [Ferruginibacter sp.]